MIVFMYIVSCGFVAVDCVVCDLWSIRFDDRLLNVGFRCLCLIAGLVHVFAVWV